MMTERRGESKKSIRMFYILSLSYNILFTRVRWYIITTVHPPPYITEGNHNIKMKELLQIIRFLGCKWNVINLISLIPHFRTEPSECKR